MSNKIKGFTVVLEKDVSEEYAGHISNAIRMITGVIDVTHVIANPHDFIEQSRCNTAMTEKLLKVISDINTR